MFLFSFFNFFAPRPLCLRPCCGFLEAGGISDAEGRPGHSGDLLSPVCGFLPRRATEGIFILRTRERVARGDGRFKLLVQPPRGCLCCSAPSPPQRHEGGCGAAGAWAGLGPHLALPDPRSPGTPARPGNGLPFPEMCWLIFCGFFFSFVCFFFQRFIFIEPFSVSFPRSLLWKSWGFLPFFSPPRPSLPAPSSRREGNPSILGLSGHLGSVRMELVLKRSVSVVGVSCCKYLFIFL